VGVSDISLDVSVHSCLCTSEITANATQKKFGLLLKEPLQRYWNRSILFIGWYWFISFGQCLICCFWVIFYKCIWSMMEKNCCLHV